MSAPLKIGVMPRVAATEIQVWWSPPVSQWVAVGYNSSRTVCIATSPDGITWTDSSNNPFSGGGAIGIAWSGSLWIAIGNNLDNTVSIATSPDGITWTDASNNPFFGGYCIGIVWSSPQNKWVAVGNNVDYTVCIATSPDGMTWTDSSNNPFSGGNGVGIAYSPSQNQWVAVGGNGDYTVCIATSPDGLVWTDSSNNPFSGGGGQGIAWGSSQWVAVGRNQYQTVCIATSPDGMTWTDSSNNPFFEGVGLGISHNGSYWVAVGYNAERTVCIATSTDGMTWTDASNNPFPGYTGIGIAWSAPQNQWVAVGGNLDYTVCIATSPDGMTWTPSQNNPFSGGPTSGIAFASSPPVTNYVLQKTVGDTNPIIIPASESKGTYTVTGLTPLTDYTYMIQADCSGSYSDIAVYRTVKTSGRPQPVTGLTKTQSIVDGQLRVTFAWSTPSDYAQYYVYGLRVKGKDQAIYEGQDITTIGNSYTFTVDPTREYTFSIQRGNDAGYSSLVSIDTVATTFDPRSVPGLWLWLDANDVGNGVPVPLDIEFSVWKDKSGKENDAVLGAGAAPASVTDGGLGKHVSIGSTWFNLTKSSWAYNQYFTFFVVENASTASSEIIYIGNRNNGADKIKIGYTNDGSIIFSTYADNTTLGSTTGIANAPPMNVTCFTNYGGKIAYWNKSVSGKNTSAANSFIVDSLLTIGVPTNVGRSEVYEVLMYRGIMKEDDREAITNYLYDKWIPRPSTVIQVPVQNGMIMWLDAADKDTMKDASGASVVVDGDLIYQWNDKSGRGNHMFNVSETATYSNYGDYALCVEVNNTSTENIIQTNDATLFLVIDVLVISEGYNLFTHDVSGNYGLIITPTGKLSWRSGPTANNNQINLVAERPFMFYGTIKKGQLLSGTFIDQDGVQKVYSTDSFSYSLGSSTIEFNSNASSGTALYGEVIYYNRVLSDSELQVNAEYLANKWGFSLAEPASAPRLPGLKLWLDSSDPYTVFKTGSTVTAWHDKSGLENNAIAYGAPTAGGGITFHGSDYFSLPDGALPRGDYSYYIVSDFSADSAIVSGGAKDVVGMWVAVGSDSQSSTIQTSYDGMTWTQSTNNPFFGGVANGIAYSPSQNQWVAVGYNSGNSICIASSPDGISWTDASNNPFYGGQAHGIAWGGSKWVAVGQIPDYTVSIASSTDGMTWIEASNNLFSDGSVWGIAWGDSKWIAVGSGTSGVSIATSIDGMTWADVSNNPFFGGLGEGIAWSGTLWVAVGYNSTQTVSIASSPDGMTWTDSSNNPFSGWSCTGIAWSGSLWMAIGHGPIGIATSSDGMNWTPNPTNPYYGGGVPSGIAWSESESYWTIVGSPGDNGSIFTSTDGITWAESSSLLVGYGIAYGEGDPHALNMSINVITDSSGTFAQTVYDYSSYRKMLVNASLNYSYDSVTWYDASGGNQLHNSIFYANGLWVAVGGYGFSYVYSNDGINWVNPGVGTNGFSADKAYAIVYANGLWIAGGTYTEGGSPITYSSTGSTWNAATISNLTTCNSIAYGKDPSGNDLWVAGGDTAEDPLSYPLHYSANGMTWLTVSGSDTLFSNCAVVIYGKGIWLAGGTGANTMMYSITGYTWIPDISGSAVLGGACNSIALGEDLSGVELFVASGGTTGESLAYSYDGLAWQTCIYDISLNTFGNVSYSNGLWLCPCDPVIATSRDGITWISSGVQNLGFTVIAGGRGAVTENKSTLTDTNAIPSKTVIVESIKGASRSMFLSGLTGATDSAAHVQDSTQNYIGWDLSGYMHGTIKEMLVYNTAHNAEKRLQVERYLKNKWFPTAFKPTDVSGASLWLDASEENFIYGSKNRIQTWKDKTGNCIVKQDVPWAQPIYSLDSVTGLRGVQFGADAIANGLVDISGSPFGSGNSWSVFTVHRYDYSTDLDEAVNGCVCTVYEASFASASAPTAFKAGSTFVTLENGVVPSELKLTEGSSVAISADVRRRPVMTGQLVNSLMSTHTVNGADYPIGGLLVAGGNNIPYIAISTDGMTWTDASNNPFSSASGIGYNGSYWVAVGHNSGSTVCIATSPDGMTWTDSSNNPFSGGYGNGIAWNGLKWVAVGYNLDQSVCIANSLDGITWTDISNTPFSGGQAYGIAASTSLWVAVGRNADFTLCIATSPDGGTWAQSMSDPFSGRFGFGVAYSSSQNQWIAVGTNSAVASTVCIASSTDGITWTPSENNPFSGGSGRGIASNGSQWVAVGANSDHTVCIATSSDGMTWTDSSNNPFDGVGGRGISWSGSYWVAVGANSGNTVSIATSPDGMTWTPSQNNPFPAAVGNAVASSPPQPLQPMANARMNIGFTAPLTPALGGAMRGYIYEILCYKGAVSPSDQQKIEGYLAWKWGIQDVLAQTHPYYLGPP